MSLAFEEQKAVVEAKSKKLVANFRHQALLPLGKKSLVFWSLERRLATLKLAVLQAMS